MATLDTAILLAAQAHQGQVDKAGQPYILHPLRMMFKMQTEQAMIVAILHDVVEDTAITLEDLRTLGFAAEVVEAVECLTKREDESYEAFIERLRPNPLARGVKLADLEDNMDLRRLPVISEKDWQRLQRYRRAWSKLQNTEELLHH